MTTQIGYIGEKVTLVIRQGATCGPHSVLLRNPDLSAVDMTGAAVRGQIRKKPSSTVVTADLVIEIVNSPTCSFKFSLTDEVTKDIVAGELLSSADSLYVWDIEWEDAGGVVRPIMYGPCQVFREVTRSV